jgi:hypothetical protein
MEPDRAGRKGIGAYERFSESGKESLRKDVANGHGHSGHIHAHDRVTTPNGHAHVRATTPNGHAHVRARTATPM